MTFVVSFPADSTHLSVVTVTSHNLTNEAVLARYYEVILNLRIGEYMVISNRYLVVRIR